MCDLHSWLWSESSTTTMYENLSGLHDIITDLIYLHMIFTCVLLLFVLILLLIMIMESCERTKQSEEKECMKYLEV